MTDHRRTGQLAPATPPRIVIVGGGISGLVAAVYAARQGASVHLLEGGRNFGGRALTQERDGFLFNMGPHALYSNGAAMEILQDLDAVPAGHVAPLQGALGVADGKLHLLPISTGALFRTRALALREKAQFARLLGRLPKIDPGECADQSLNDLIEAAALSGRPAEVLRAIGRLATYAHAPDQLSADVFLNQLRGAAEGVLYLDGGWQRMVDALAMRGRQAGAELRTGAKVEALSRNGSGFCIQLKDGERLFADAVILALPPTTVARLLEGTGIAAPDTSAMVPARVASLDIGLNALPRKDRPFALGLDQATYFSVHSLTADLAPDGHYLVHVARYLGPNEQVSPDQLRADLEALTDLVQPGWRSHEVTRIFRPNLTVAHTIPIASNGGLRGRVAVADAGRPGLFFAGDWVGDQGVLADAAMASGAAAARAATAVKAASICEKPDAA